MSDVSGIQNYFSEHKQAIKYAKVAAIMVAITTIVVLGIYLAGVPGGLVLSACIIGASVYGVSLLNKKEKEGIDSFRKEVNGYFCQIQNLEKSTNPQLRENITLLRHRRNFINSNNLTIREQREYRKEFEQLRKNIEDARFGIILES
ncbi:MAG: hypothetical protein HZB76_02200 [Chlamydiae bacterium]|nr:hypothetical protein [Chlamydiota bacterium]